MSLSGPATGTRLILVTGAAGKTGRLVIQKLAARGLPVRAFVRREAQAEVVQAAGAQDVVVGGLDDAAALRLALRGVRALYHICPNMHPDEAAIGRGLVALARAAGVEHFGYHSVLHPQTEAMPHHWNKLQVEAALFESGLTFTILQPAPYMQNLLAGWAAIVERGAHVTPYPAETRLSLVDLADVAEAAALVLTQPGHGGATYELCGTQALTQTQVAEALGQSLGRPVQAEAISIADWERQARASGLGGYTLATLKQMFAYYESFGLSGNPNTLRWLLDRAPTTLAEFATRARRERAGGV